MSKTYRGGVVGFLLAAMTTLGSGSAIAQVSLAGDWTTLFHEDQPERVPGPELGDYLGLPISVAARMYADAWKPSRITEPEQQCRAHAAPYIHRGPDQFRLWEEKDPTSQDVVAIKIFVNTFAQTQTIYMDGRPHPSELAPHTWQGFKTGKWEGNQLSVYTTHIKQGWVRRNGLPQSSKATLMERYIRHGNQLTIVNVLQDPVYLTEPLIKSENFVLNMNVQPAVYQNWLSCQPDEEIAGRPSGYVPHYLPGTNTDVQEFAAKYKLPFEATRGGADTMYPDYQQKLATTRTAAAK
jgi:hypothetical protein